MLPFHALVVDGNKEPHNKVTRFLSVPSIHPLIRLVKLAIDTENRYNEYERWYRKAFEAIEECLDSKAITPMMIILSDLTLSGSAQRNLFKSPKLHSLLLQDIAFKSPHLAYPATTLQELTLRGSIVDAGPFLIHAAVKLTSLTICKADAMWPRRPGEAASPVPHSQEASPLQLIEYFQGRTPKLVEFHTSGRPLDLLRASKSLADFLYHTPSLITIDITDVLAVDLMSPNMLLNLDVFSGNVQCMLYMRNAKQLRAVELQSYSSVGEIQRALTFIQNHTPQLQQFKAAIDWTWDSPLLCSNVALLVPDLHSLDIRVRFHSADAICPHLQFVATLASSERRLEGPGHAAPLFCLACATARVGQEHYIHSKLRKLRLEYCWWSMGRAPRCSWDSWLIESIVPWFPALEELEVVCSEAAWGMEPVEQKERILYRKAISTRESWSKEWLPLLGLIEGE